jgi:thiamine biosynthesis lipoprotein
MPSSSRPLSVERARPLLGTLVTIRATFGEGVDGASAIDAAFAEINTVHRLMSFHDADSDLSRLHRAGVAPVRIDRRTAEVLAFALGLAAASDGAFDPAVGGAAVARGALPRPAGAPDPDPDASWRDVELEGDRARLRRPVWLDLGGVAKGYAVDRAIERLRKAGVQQACVNAGGDLRLFGPDAEPVALRAGDRDQLAVIELRDGAAASSGGDPDAMAPHFDGRTRRKIGAGRFVCVTAPTCMAADALTKVVLALGPAAEELLGEHLASAHDLSPDGRWRHWGLGS